MTVREKRMKKQIENLKCALTILVLSDVFLWVFLLWVFEII